mmetsp:Transcript_22462/g.69506  ORF Transcript_22462/g.69506 Transcript_22462/m.69506 type:complete len:202 (-) Transcript_22462:77-682(-)
MRSPRRRSARAHELVLLKHRVALQKALFTVDPDGVAARHLCVLAGGRAHRVVALKVIGALLEKGVAHPLTHRRLAVAAVLAARDLPDDCAVGFDGRVLHIHAAGEEVAILAGHHAVAVCVRHCVGAPHQLIGLHAVVGADVLALGRALLGGVVQQLGILVRSQEAHRVLGRHSAFLLLDDLTGHEAPSRLAAARRARAPKE